MKINFYGNACFSIKDGDFTIVTDPHDKLSKSLKGNVVTVSNKDPEHSNVKAVEGEPKIFNWPGEYETAGVHMQGIASFHDPKDAKEQKENTVFKIELNGTHLCHLGALGTALTAEQIEEIGDVDILFLPVGGSNTVNAKKAKEIIEQIEPRVIIPMSYCDENNECNIDQVKPFLTEMGSKVEEPLDEFVVKKSEMPDDSTRILVLNVKQ